MDAATTVRATTVDDFAAETHDIRVGAIKTDVEGHDLAVLRGAGETIRRFGPLVLTEARATDDLFVFCSQLDYSVWSFAFPIGEPRKAKLTAMTPGSGLGTKMLFLVPPRLKKSFG
jgi:hypothetical protein